MIYHLTTRKFWKRALATGDYRIDSLEDEGFIHCSTLAQILPVAEKFFPHKNKLVVLLIENTLLTSILKWEPPSDGAPPVGALEGELFPHIYGPLNLDAVVKVLDIERNAEGLFELPGM